MSKLPDTAHTNSGDEVLLEDITQELAGILPASIGLSRRSSLMLGMTGIGAVAMLQPSSPASASTRPDGTRTAAQMDDDLNKYECEKLYHRLRQARDLQDYDTFVSCYYPDTIIEISWFKGTAAEFAKGTADMFTKMNSFHEVFPSVVTLKGNRAIVSTLVVVHLIADLDGAEVDAVSYCMARLRVERRTTEWLVAGEHSIYMYDTCIPTNPQVLPKLDLEKLSKYRPSYRYMSYMQESRGIKPTYNQPGMDKPETVKVLLDSDKAWLDGHSG